MAFILHARLNRLINYICIVNAYYNEHMIHQILSTSMFWGFLMDMCTWDVCEGRPLSLRLSSEMPTLLTCLPQTALQS